MSGYSINRGSGSWQQTLDFSKRLGALNFHNGMEIRTRRDKGQNDLRFKNGGMKVNLDHSRMDYGRWTVGLGGDFRRDSQLSRTSDIINNRSDFALTADTKLFEHALHRLAPAMERFGVVSTANLGYGTSESVNRRTSPSGGLLDTTKVNGLFQRYDAALDGDVQALHMRVGMTAENRNGDSDTRQRNAVTDSLVRVVSARTMDRSRTYDGSLDWNPAPVLRASARGNSASSRIESWDPFANGGLGAQETTQQDNESGSVELEWKRGEASNVKAQFGLGNSILDDRIQTQGHTNKTQRSSVETRVKLPDRFAALAGTELQASYSYDEAKNQLESTSDYKQGNRRVRLQGRKSLGSKVQLQLTQEAILQQYFYVDRSGDKDERRLLSDGVLTYNPSGTFNGLFNVSLGERRLISIPSASSANTSTTETYKVSADVGYVRGRMSVDQRYTIQADYSFFDFNENNNKLVRSNEVLTTIRATLGVRLGVSMTHQYQHRDSGTYVRDRALEPRRYAIGSEEIRHALTLGTRYALGSAFMIEAQQLFDQRQTGSPGSTRVNTSQRVEFFVNAQFEKKFSPNFTIRGNFKKVESNQEKDYWNGSASLERQF